VIKPESALKSIFKTFRRIFGLSQKVLFHPGPAMNSSGRLKGVLLALTAVFFLSVTPALVKSAISHGMDPISLLSLRMVVGAVLLWVLFGLFSPDSLHIGKRGLLFCAVVALANSTSMGLYYLALNRINVSIAHVTFSVFPLIAIIFLALAGEPISRLALIRFGLAFAGIYFLVAPVGKIDMVGMVLVLGTATFYALHMNCIQWFLKDEKPRTVALYVVTFMALFTSLADFLKGWEWPTISSEGWLVILYTGIFSTALARLAMFTAIKSLGSGQMALLGPVETLLAVTWALLFLGESLAPLQVLGALLIVSSTLLVIKS
jgi:drug/metabolite transporter (DMT)-like permease